MASMARRARVGRARVVGLAELLGIERRDQVGRARQAAGMGGENAVLALFHTDLFS
jgi:hypothetical protein